MHLWLERDPLRAYLRTPDLQLRLVRLPAYSPDFNADEHIWAWVRAEVAGGLGAPPPLVKAVTYHRLEFSAHGAGYRARVVLDV